MSIHNICFFRQIRKILCGYPLLSVAMYVTAQLTENMPEEAHVLKVDPKKVIAEINYPDGKEPVVWK